MGRKITAKLSIIITAYNNWKLTARCIAHLFQGTYPKENFEIIFVDNASTDKTETLVTYLVEQGEPIKYLKQKENLNFLKGTNLGWKNVNSPYVMLLNNDVFVDHDCIEIMMKIIDSDPKIGIVGAMEYLPSAIRSKSKPFIFFKPKELLDPILYDYKDLNFENEPNFVDVDIVGSACCIIRKEVWDKIGYFDELFLPCMFEQEDFFLRTKIAGFRIVMSTKSKMVHAVGSTTVFNNPFYQDIIRINKLKFLEKWKNLGGLK